MAQSAGVVEYIDSNSAEGKAPTKKKNYPGYDTKQFYGNALVTLELWRMHNTPSLLSIPSLLWPRGIVPDRVLSMGQREPFDI